MLDERRRKEFIAEEKAEERVERDRHASQQVTRHYREREKQRRQKYEDEGKLAIYEQVCWSRRVPRRNCSCRCSSRLG